MTAWPGREHPKGGWPGPAAAGPRTAPEARLRRGLPRGSGRSLWLSLRWGSHRMKLTAKCVLQWHSVSSGVQLASVYLHSEGKPPKRPLSSLLWPLAPRVHLLSYDLPAEDVSYKWRLEHGLQCPFFPSYSSGSDVCPHCSGQALGRLRACP